MKISFVLLQILNFIACVSTIVIYWYHINLWEDQALVFTSLCGIFFSGSTLLILGIAFLKKVQFGLIKGWIGVIIPLITFVICVSALFFVFWNKPIS